MGRRQQSDPAEGGRQDGEQQQEQKKEQRNIKPPLLATALSGALSGALISACVQVRGRNHSMACDAPASGRTTHAPWVCAAVQACNPAPCSSLCCAAFGRAAHAHSS